jgi:hypothetical protein
MPKPSAALTRFSPVPNMAAAVAATRVSPHLPSAPASPPTPPASHRQAQEHGAYCLNRRLPLRRIARRAERSRPGAPIWWGRATGREPDAAALGCDWAAAKEGATCAAAAGGRRRGAGGRGAAAGGEAREEGERRPMEAARGVCCL